MSLVEPNVYSYKDPNPIDPYGVAICSLGLTQWDMVNGYGPLTRGLLWQFYDVWCDVEFYDNLSTSWSNSNSVITTTWTNSNSVISTTWSASNSVITTTWTSDNASITTTWSNEGIFNGF